MSEQTFEDRIRKMREFIHGEHFRYQRFAHGGPQANETALQSGDITEVKNSERVVLCGCRRGDRVLVRDKEDGVQHMTWIGFPGSRNTWEMLDGC